MILCWATFIAILGRIQPVSRGLDTPEAVKTIPFIAQDPPKEVKWPINTEGNEVVKESQVKVMRKFHLPKWSHFYYYNYYYLWNLKELDNFINW